MSDEARVVEYLDPVTLEPADGPMSWSLDPAFVVQLVDTLLRAGNPDHVAILTAYYDRIAAGRWPEPGRNEPYHPNPLWSVSLIHELKGWDRKGKMNTDARRVFKRIAVRRKNIELDLMRQILEA
ncbi:MAG TPA: hypothetical protein VGI53_07390, partial [Dyella sp.]